MADPIRTLYHDIEVQQLKKLKKYKPPKAMHFHASALSRCVRELYFKTAGYIPAQEKPIMWGYGPDGDMHHDDVRRQLKKVGVKLQGVSFMRDRTVKETESHILKVTNAGSPDFWISMRLDGIAWLNHRKHVLEIKSLGFWKYKPIAELYAKTGSEAAVIGWLKENRRDIMFQVHANMMGVGIPRTYLLFKNRDACVYGLHAGDKIIGGPVIDFDEHIWNAMVARISLVAKHLEMDTPPEPEFLVGSKECNLCKYQHLCHEATRREKVGKTPTLWHPQLGEKLR